ncbi:MAG: hypothetical protein KAU26_06350 [Methylococcales bacterium]|nr:hypothetical protein [Methylococcales bacterium]
MRAKEQKYLDKLGLISFERMDVFNLLVDTLLKKRENIILSGVMGVGKTTLLQTLEREKKDQWTLCLFYGTDILSFSDIKDELRRVLRAQGNIPETERLYDMLEYYEEHKKRIILVLDNAGRFPSGFIEGLIQYSLKYPALKIVFVLTKKQLLVKNKTDKAIDHCYFIEISALEKKQMGLFLTMLATTPNPLLVKADINPKLINQLYISSKGIPKAVIARLHKRKTFWFRWRKYILFLLFLLLCAGTIYYNASTLKQHKWFKAFFLESSESLKKKFSATIKPTLFVENDSVQIFPKILPNVKNNEVDALNEKPLSEKKVTKKTVIKPTLFAANDSAQISPKILPNVKNNEVDALNEKPLFEKKVTKKTVKNLDQDVSFSETSMIKPAVVHVKKLDENASQQKKNTNSTPIKKQLLVTKPSEKINKKHAKSPPKFSDDSEWVLQKSAKRYTLQLMITNKKKALLKILNQHTALKNQLKYVGIKRNNKQQYLLLYGSFSRVASAQNKVKTLPKQFKAAWPKRFSAIQAEIKKSR